MNSPIVPASPMTPPPPSPHELVLKVYAMPADANAYGDIFGGWVMSQVDLAGAVIPVRYARHRVATVAVKEFVFRQAVKVGDLVSLYAHVTRIGTTSITVVVEAFAERLHQKGEYHKVTEATLVYVALDEQGQPCPVVPA
ncbi:MAG: hypothetical protein RJA36_3268 [Pseudomonadota bacterium]|jgi:acyl-CoA thioesterase YciA